MAFYAANFAYDGIISSEYGLRITSMDSEDISDGANVELLTQKIYRKPTVFLLGVEQTPVLEIPVKINVPDQLSATEDSIISNWLFGNLNYKKLQILQYDMQYVYYNCIFTNKQSIRYGNVIRGYNATISCDSPFAWEYPQTVSYDYGTGTSSVFDRVIINNTSDNGDYTYPTMTFKMNVFGGNLSIVNNSDILTSGSVTSTREFLFEDLDPEEEITIDNDHQIITSSTGGNRLPNFTGYNWMRYVKGNNIFDIEGNIESVSFTHQLARKMS